jgi:hypothetical protein
MLLVKTYLSASPIHGIGLFAAEPIAKGTVIWCFDERVDRRFTKRNARNARNRSQQILDKNISQQTTVPSQESVLGPRKPWTRGPGMTIKREPESSD